MKQVKITVFKKEFYAEFADAYLTDGSQVGACPLVNVGDVFVYEGAAQMPEGFCPWAWLDIAGGVRALAAGGTFAPWNHSDGMQIVCCTDGIRPVVFKIEAF